MLSCSFHLSVEPVGFKTNRANVYVVKGFVNTDRIACIRLIGQTKATCLIAIIDGPPPFLFLDQSRCDTFFLKKKISATCET